jgi:polar amino acid transport system permease protein
VTEIGAFERDLLEQLPLILSGLEQTLKLAVLASLSGFLLGIVVFYCSISQNKFVRTAIKGYISFFIGMPLIVLLFLMYYGLPQWGIKCSPFTVAMIGFTMNIAAYNAAYLNTAFNGLDLAELEAAKAQGFSAFKIFQFIINYYFIFFFFGRINFFYFYFFAELIFYKINKFV